MLTTIAPAAADLAILACFAVILVGLGFVGSLIARHTAQRDYGIVAGWGLISIAFTMVGVIGILFGYVAVFSVAVVGLACAARIRTLPRVDWAVVAVAVCLLPTLFIAPGSCRPVPTRR